MQTKNDKIKQIRKKIDTIDAHIIQLLKKRFQAVKKIGNLKRKYNLKVADSDREEYLQNRLAQLASQNDLKFPFLSSLWKEILKESYRIQNESEVDK
jgi:chorismate mutase